MNSYFKVMTISGVLLICMVLLSKGKIDHVKAQSVKSGYTAISGKGYNVATTGTNALYTKPGNMRGAKLVASKAKLKSFGSYSKSDAAAYVFHNKNNRDKGSTYYFYVYGYQTTNSGSVYYKMVSQNGKYRGYIYGGKKVGKITGGIKKVQTTKKVNIPSYFSGDVGIATPGKLWNVVPYTAYKTKLLGKMTSGESTTIPHLAKFKIDSAAERTRERDTYYHVIAQDNSALTGWVNAKYVRKYVEIQNNWGIVDN
ncbi:hypothetical protein [Levilactobacillus cerevisiae]|uniref:hypothetical protein n=1 Tax=Levilactobacillus cerevisiae TaxID=1704076 RepID=UPI000F7ABC07|nr:hypothetical protein [Levilactobacillus cerevisiae]